MFAVGNGLVGSIASRDGEMSRYTAFTISADSAVEP